MSKYQKHIIFVRLKKLTIMHFNWTSSVSSSLSRKRAKKYSVSALNAIDCATSYRADTLDFDKNVLSPSSYSSVYLFVARYGTYTELPF